VGQVGVGHLENSLKTIYDDTTYPRMSYSLSSFRQTLPLDCWYTQHMNDQTSKVLSCGLLVQSPDGWFLAHATRTPRWDLPKGRIEPDETPLEAALREALEETGLDLAHLSDRIEDRGRHGYIPKKDLHLFFVEVPEAFDLSTCHCTTHVENENGSYPETDRWEWVPLCEVRNRLGKGMIKYMEARGLLPEIKPSPAMAQTTSLRR
jgi:8-oxo-dGTP pyrophosphatase MutT (NUDIX family)